MSYILPIAPYQQMNYQLRDVQKTRMIDTVERPYPIILSRGNAEQGRAQTKKSNPNLGLKPSIYRQQIAAVTGKGIHFDTII